jgi:tetratricopeptide (TPR) repeat protein
VDADLDRRLAEVGSGTDVDELVDLGCDLAEVGRQVDAERCFRRAADLGSAVASFNLGNTLAALSREREAVAAYERALAGGEMDAWLNLGSVLQQLGDQAGAMRAFREAFQAGDVEGALALAFCLREQGEREQAVAAARDAAAAGSLAAAGVVACWEWDDSLDPALERALRAGAEHYPPARVALADLLCSTGRVTEACEGLERGAKLGEQESWLPLGNVYADEFGDFAAARDAYLGGIAAGDTHCHHNLGVLLVAQGLTDDAEEQFRLGAEAGDELASRTLRELTDGD